MWYLYRIICVGICFSIFGLSSVATACDIVLENSSQSRFEEYNSQNRKVFPQKLNINLRNIGAEKCNGFLSVTAQGRNNYLNGSNGEFMTFRVYKARNTSQTLFQSNSNVQNRVPITLEAGSTKMIELFLVIDRFQNVSAGTYISDLDMTLTSSNLTPISSAQIRVGTKINPILQANITGTNGSATSNDQSHKRHSLSLGELLPNKNHRLGLQIRANTPVIISVASENKGALRHEIETAEIPYAFEINGQSLDMKQTSQIDGRSSLKTDGLTNPINIGLTDFGDKMPAGNYSDVITFQISAR